MTNLSSVRASLFFLFSLMASTSAVGRPALVVIDPGHGGHDRGGIAGPTTRRKGVYT
jgi:N-acetylmuramoyl-L-alanine amidase